MNGGWGERDPRKIYNATESTRFLPDLCSLEISCYSRKSPGPAWRLASLTPAAKYPKLSRSTSVCSGAAVHSVPLYAAPSTCKPQHGPRGPHSLPRRPPSVRAQQNPEEAAPLTTYAASRGPTAAPRLRNSAPVKTEEAGPREAPLGNVRRNMSAPPAGKRKTAVCPPSSSRGRCSRRLWPPFSKREIACQLKTLESPVAP